MANHPKVTAQKRMRERARQEWQKEKAQRREDAKARRASSPRAAGGEDPDIAGIIPGPQANPWGEDEPWGEPDVPEVEEDKKEGAE